MNAETVTSEVNEVIPQEAPEQLSQPEVVASDGEGSGAPPQVPAEPEYKPDFSYKVYDTVKEFDPRLRGIIKTKEDEAWVRDVVTKAEGLEINKRNLEKIQKEYEKVNSEYVPLKKDVEQVLRMRDSGDLDSLFTVLGIDEKKILSHAYKKAKLMDLSPEERADYDRYNKVQFSQYSLEQQNEEMRRKLEHIELTQRKAELQTALNSTDYSSVAKEFDQRNGENAFYNEVIRRGAFYEAQMGQTKSVGEVVSEIINLYGLKREAPKAKVSSEKVDLPVIPNTSAGGAAPVAKRIKEPRGA